MSPSCSCTSRWSLFAIRRSAESGSPWLPVETTTTFSSGKFSISRGWMKMPCGAFAIPRLEAMLKFLRIERPTSATLRSSCYGGVDHLLDAVDVGGERGDDDPPLALRELLQQGRADARLRGRDARAVGVGRVAAEQQQAVAADLGEARDVGGAPVDRGLVELVVAGHQHRAELGGDQDAAHVGDRVGRGGRARARTDRASPSPPPAAPAAAPCRRACARRASSGPCRSSACRRR